MPDLDEAGDDHPSTGERITVYFKSSSAACNIASACLTAASVTFNCAAAPSEAVKATSTSFCRNELLPDERLGPIQFPAPLGQIDPRLVERRSHIGKTCDRLITSRLIGERIDARHHLIRFHLGIKIGVEAFDHAGDLAADLNRR